MVSIFKRKLCVCAVDLAVKIIIGVIEIAYHRIAEIGRDPWSASSPPPAQSRVS